MVLSELLAPAGTYKILVVAINAGADAVYIAGQRYGARAFAQNFTSEEIERAVKYAHLNGSTVHVTVNTLFNSAEILDVLRYIQFLYRVGVDAVIVQDIGLIYLINNFIPQMEVHSSTQMTLRDYNSILWAKNEGINRVILPREMSVDEISHISNKLKDEHINMDLEVFGHGSLCYCISGDCYMSSFISGRSANRGACAQPCRSQYKLKYHNYSISNGCLISTHDLGTFKDLKKISDAGVCSLKVEGRLKSEDYVATVIHAYRTLIDNMDNEDKYSKEYKKIEEDLNLSFNRYYTNGYILNDEPGEVMGRESSFHQGLYLGKVSSINGELLDIVFENKDHPILATGDGIGFKHNNHIRGIYLDKIVEQNKKHILIETTRDLRVNSEVYISYSKELHDKQKQYLKEQIKPNTIISLDISCDKKLRMNINVSFKVKDDIINFGYKSEHKFEKAIKLPITEDTIISQMSKMGGTPFIPEEIKVNHLPKDIFMPLGRLNKIRRNLLDEATEKLLEYYKPNPSTAGNIKKTIDNYITECKNIPLNIKYSKYMGLNVYVDSLELVNVADNYPINRIYFDPSFSYDNKNDYFNNIEEVLKKAKSLTLDKELVWVISAFASDNDLNKIKEVYDNLKENDIDISIMGDSVSLTRIFENTSIYGSHNLNIWNNYSVGILDKNRFKGLTISSELSSKEIKELISKSKEYDTELELIIHGNQEIMVTKDNFSNLKDGNNLELTGAEYAVLEDKPNKAKFKIYQDYNNQSHFFNNDCLSLIDEIDSLKEMGLQSVTLDCRFTKERYCSKVISLYVQKLEDSNPHHSYLENINEISYSNMNKGNFINGRILEDKKRKRKIKSKKE